MLHTKLNKPKIPDDLLLRSHLISKLEDSSHLPLILVSAPAGYGKSILVSQWLDKQEKTYSWLALNQSMSDSPLFLTYFIESLERCSAIDWADLKDLAQQYHFLEWEAIIDLIINKINTLNEYVRLILDDYHLIRNQEIHQLINAIIKENINNFQLVIITRRDPPLQFRPLRLYHKLLEIRMHDLRFDKNEIGELLKMKPTFNFSPDEVNELLSRAEGWIMGIRMMLLAMPVPKREGEKGSFDYVTNDLDILIDHIGDNFSPKFFKQIQLCSLCEQFSKELIDSIFKFSFNESGDANNFLEQLIDSNLFLIPTGDEEYSWFRFHHLFGDALSRRLKKKEPDLIHPLYIHISSWFASEGLIDEAIHYAIKAENYNLACDLITEHRVSRLDQGIWWDVQKWLEKIPEQIRKSNVDLLLAELRICEDTWKLEDISSILSRLESLGIENSDARTRSFYLFHLGHHFTFVRSDAKKAIEYFEQSKKLYENDNMFGARRELILAIARQMAGKSTLALKSLAEIERNFEPSSLMHMRSLNSRVYVHLLSGNIPEADNSCEKFYFAARNSGFNTLEAFSWYFQANIAMQTFNKDIITKFFNGVRCFQGMLNYRVYFDALAGSILFYSLKENETATESFLQEMSEMVSKVKDTKFQIYYLSIRARISLHRGQGEKELAWAQTDWVKQSPATYFFLIDVPDLTKLRIIVNHGSIMQVEEALRVLSEVEAFLKEVHNNYHTVDIELLKAMALLRVGRKEDANELLSKALTLAQQNDYIRPIIEAHRVMPSLFDLVNQSPNSRRILSRIGLNNSNSELPPVSNAKFDELSLREQQVIRLIAAGLRNKEIADELNISSATVKSHLTHIYRKLDVPNRTSMLNKVKYMSILS